MPGAAQLQHPGPQLAGGLARAFRAGPGLGEQVQPALAQQGGHLVDAGGGVAEPVGDLGGGHLVGEVGAQRLIPALRRARRLGEVLRAVPHPAYPGISSHLAELIPEIVELYQAAARRHAGHSDALAGSVRFPSRQQAETSSGQLIEVVTRPEPEHARLPARTRPGTSASFVQVNGRGWSFQ